MGDLNLIQTSSGGSGGSTPSGAANLVYATPNGSSGNASLRALVGADFPLQDVPAYFFGGLPLGDPNFITNGASAVVVAGRVQVVLFYISDPIIVRKCSTRVVTGVAAATVNVGIYSSAGNLLIDSGAMSAATSNSSVTATLGSAVTLNPGWYFYAIACSSLTPTFRSLFNITGTGPSGELLNLNQNRFYVGGNSVSSGSLPSTIGTVTTNGSQGILEALFES